MYCIGSGFTSLRTDSQPATAVLSAISLATYAVAMVFNVLLVAYGASRDATPVVVAGVVNLACASVIVAVLLGSHRRSAA